MTSGVFELPLKPSNCETCGIELPLRRTLKGKSAGQVYRLKLCDSCRLKKRQAVVEKTRTRPGHYDSFRKHFTQICENCNREFPVKGLSNSGTIKSCSPECRAEGIRKRLKESHAVERIHAVQWKAHIKLFERTQQVPLLARGPGHWKALKCVLTDPEGNSYEVTNVTDWVRNNMDKFEPSDVAWRPAKNASLVRQVGFRPSRSVGCQTCRASGGLRNVLTGRRNSWKGWTGVKLEHEYKRKEN